VDFIWQQYFRKTSFPDLGNNSNSLHCLSIFTCVRRSQLWRFVRQNNLIPSEARQPALLRHHGAGSSREYSKFIIPFSFREVVDCLVLIYWATINDEKLSNIKSMFLYIDIMESTCFSEEIYVSMVSGNDDFFVVFLHPLH
jgi:hypothetical protein